MNALAHVTTALSENVRLVDIAMFKLKSATRLAITVALIVASNLWLAMMLGIAPDLSKHAIRKRIELSEMIAISAARLAEANRLPELSAIMQQVTERNPELESIGVRKRDKTYRLTFGTHLGQWQPGIQSAEQISIDIKSNNLVWGTIELRYLPLSNKAAWALFEYPMNLMFFLSASTCLLAWSAFSRTFRYLDPTKVVPGRVRSALDSLAEGLVLIDTDQRIVHANQVFARMVLRTVDEMIGTPLAQFEWKENAGETAAQTPWAFTLTSKQPVSGRVLELVIDGEHFRYNVNTNPISGSKDECRGVLISFDDVTLLERKKHDLAIMVETLKKSRDEIRKQNVKLKFWASRDPLTKCFNRRSFWELFECQWEESAKDQLSVIMVDIDHFKSVNDDHGHSKGDEVLRETGAMLLHMIGDQGSVCRYGGEEFAILLSKLDLESATKVAQTLHQAFQRCQLGGLSITASIGLSNRSFRAMDAQHLLDQADQCLYAAKRNGRNQVVRFDECAKIEEKKTRTLDTTIMPPAQVSYASVMALYSSLAYRDRTAAIHSQRVADLCVIIGRKALDPRTLYWLETCALLRQVGRIESSSVSVTNNESVEASAVSDGDTCIDFTKEILRSTFGSEELIWIITGQSCPEVMKASTTIGQRLELCAMMLSCAVELVDSIQINKPVNAEIVRGRLARLPFSVDSNVIQSVVTSLSRPINADGVSSDGGTVSFSNKDARVVSLIGPFMDDLCTAIANRDLTQLKQVVVQLDRCAAGSPDKSVNETVGPLMAAVESRDPEFDKLTMLADQLLDLCRITRQSIVQTIPDTRPISKANVSAK